MYQRVQTELLSHVKAITYAQKALYSHEPFIRNFAETLYHGAA